MSGSEREGKGENKMVSIPLSSDEETSLGKYIILSGFESTLSFSPSFAFEVARDSCKQIMAMLLCDI